RRAAGDETDEQADRQEQQQRIVEKVAERTRTVAALGDEPQRQPHQRAEGGVDRAEVDGRAAEEEDSQRNHLLLMLADPRPPLARAAGARSSPGAGRPCGAAAAR